MQSLTEKIGTRIKLVFTDDRYTELKPGAIGTVTFVDDTGTIFVDWEDGSTLGLIPGVDSYQFI